MAIQSPLIRIENGSLSKRQSNHNAHLKGSEKTRVDKCSGEEISVF